ncbi:hypothetical protein F442_07387 [Phytophthora nicotianae P10297]|uniref:Uncharacterized protein n=1 Tax=Phytophthora nicotianae P10297 TaxID=1317064 RepID=W2ZH25_PHYNI|nr:hypothetical protein F442_07387 [Phytophthora nicotianae P10297]
MKTYMYNKEWSFCKSGVDDARTAWWRLKVSKGLMEAREYLIPTFSADIQKQNNAIVVGKWQWIDCNGFKEEHVQYDNQHMQANSPYFKHQSYQMPASTSGSGANIATSAKISFFNICQQNGGSLLRRIAK